MAENIKEGHKVYLAQSPIGCGVPEGMVGVCTHYQGNEIFVDWDDDKIIESVRVDAPGAALHNMDLRKAVVPT